MKYKCVNDLDKFSFRDAQMKKCEYNPGLMNWEIVGAVAKYNNPSNDTMVDRYIDTTYVRLKNPVITKFILEGAKYYDANGVLQKEVPDQEIPKEDYQKIFGLLTDVCIFVITPKAASQGGQFCCEVAVDVEEDTYWFEVEYEKVILEWEHLLNKAAQEE